MRISAVILSFNSAHHITTCVHSLVENGGLQQGLDEIIIFDNGSTDGSVEIIESLKVTFPDLIHPIFSERNIGTTRSRNSAFAISRGRWILALDSDIILPSDTLHQLIAIGAQKEDYGIVVPRLIYPDGRRQKSTDYFPTIWRKAARLLWLRRMENTEISEVERLGEIEYVDYAISAFWLLPRTTLDRVGMLDQNIFYSPEDVDYCIRVWKEGLSVVRINELTAIHDAKELSRNWRKISFGVYHVSGLAYLFVKHRYFFSTRRLYDRVGRFRRLIKAEGDTPSVDCQPTSL